MVSILILAIMTGLLIFGFDQAVSRRKASQTDQLLSWMQGVADTAVLRSYVLGITEQEGMLDVVAFYSGRWYQLAESEPFKLGEDMILEWSETVADQDSAFVIDLDEEKQLQPLVIALPTGALMPEAHISVGDSETEWGVIQWQQNGDIELNWGES